MKTSVRKLQASAIPASRTGQLTGRFNWLIWPILIIVAILLATLIKNNYWLQVTVNAEIMIIAAVGLYVTFGLNGQVSLGQAGFFAIGGYTSALLVTKLATDFGIAIVASVILSALFGLALGIPALRLKGHYLALATLGFGQVVALILVNWTWLSGGATGIRKIVAPLFFNVELKSVTNWAIFIGIIAVLSIFVVHRIENSSYGRAMKAVRDSDVAAAAMGVSLSRIKVLAFTVGAAFAGLAGSLDAGFVTYVSPGTYSLGLSVAILSMIVVGGATSPWGAVVGAIVLTFLPELLRPVEHLYLLFYGILLLVMVAYVPGGIWKAIVDTSAFIVRLVKRLGKAKTEVNESTANTDSEKVGGKA